ncbi:MAG: phage virion morphogenesis protein [Deltaproteobacteria bacterium]|nr:phage virion morphogenesis protein [Deltaproteobacteria bacterium]
MITLKSLPELSAARGRAAQIRDRLSRFGRLHESWGQELLGFTRRNFEAQGALLDEYPGGWPPLAPSTVSARKKIFGAPGSILAATGRLRRSIGFQADSRRASLFTPLEYAARHQDGLGVPRRAIFPAPAQVIRLVTPKTEAFVREALE